MKAAFVAFTLLLLSGLLFSQDAKLREEAARLLEHANAVSTSPNLPNLERVVTFRVFSDAGTKEGSFTREVVQGVGRRDEVKLGDFDLLNIWTQKKVAVKGSPGILPPELETVMSITPINLVRFDSEDVIRSMSDRTVAGRAAHCIQFDTIHGERTDNNEICVDAENGTFLEQKLGQEIIENADFFPFAGALMPGTIRFSFAGTQKIEMIQTMTALGADTNVLAAPPDAQMHGLCTAYVRPFGITMPQPKPGNGGTTAEVVLRGTVGFDGKLYGTVVQSSERPDLNDEALSIAQQWRFTPARCNGKPDPHEVDFTLEFKGR